MLNEATYGLGMLPENPMAATINFIIDSKSFPLVD
jgi:hypothetical protein